ncbi:MAG: hypothetical protein ACTSR8_00320 [Promethearchaeota archaeon]
MSDQPNKDDIDTAAYYLSQKGYSYDELCWLLAEKLMIEDRLISGAEKADSSDDALKFFINWINEMVDVGGPNLPKTISSRLGGKLGKIYKSRGVVTIKEGLEKSYKAIQGNTKIIERDENTLEVNTTYLRNFCPIGGGTSPQKAEIIQKSICTPFTMGFLNEIDSNFRYEGLIEECIVKSGGNACKYLLKKEKKK